MQSTVQKLRPRSLAVILLLAATCASVSRAQSPPASFAYVLQADALAERKPDALKQLATCGRDWIVLDARFSDREPWTPADLAALRASHAGRKVIAYLSVGEAEDYRSYWRREWDATGDGRPDAGAPSFLLAQNPEWKGNYRVKYWRADWQQIMLPNVDAVMAAGFDGVYLDIVDGFETFERQGEKFLDDRINTETGQSYRRDMVDWVKAIAARAHRTNPAALIIPQNGVQLFAHADFLAAVDGVGVEDLFTNGDRSQKVADTKYILSCLAPLVAARKPVLDIEYARKPAARAKIREQARLQGCVWLITDRELKTTGESGR